LQIPQAESRGQLNWLFVPKRTFDPQLYRHPHAGVVQLSEKQAFSLDGKFPLLHGCSGRAELMEMVGQREGSRQTLPGFKNLRCGYP
jgi:hypothetical protein